MSETLAHLQALFGDLPDARFAYLWFLSPGGEKVTRSFRDPAQAAKLVEEFGPGVNVYAGVGLSDAILPGHRRVENATVTGLVALGGDLDFTGPDKVGFPPDEAAVLAILAAMPAQPTVLVATGHGLQPWYCLNEAVVFGDDGDREAVALLSHAWQRLLLATAEAQGWKVDRVGDLARVLRVAGSVNVKQPADPVPVRLIYCDGPRMNLEDLWDLPELWPHIEAEQTAREPQLSETFESIGTATKAALAYGRAALVGECATLAAAPPGGRNNAAARAGWCVGQRIGAGILDEGEAWAALQAAVASWGVDAGGVRRTEATLRRQIAAGKLRPRGVPQEASADDLVAGHGIGAPVNENADGGSSEQEGEAPELISPMSWTQAKQRGAEVRWAWEGWLPRGYATVLAGDTGTWKTWMALALAQAVIAGTRWPDQSAAPDPGLVFWLEAEGRLRINLKRAEGMGMDLGCFFGMSDPFRAYYLDDKADFANLSLMVRLVRPQLLVVDSWNRAYLGKEDSSEVRHTLDAVQHLIEEVDAACLLMQHVRKPTGFDDENGSKVHRVRGSSALCNVAVSVIGTEVVPGADRQGVLSVWKSNLAEEWPKELGFTVRDGQVLFGEAPPMEATGTASRLAEAKEFLVTVLSDGPVRVEDVKREAKGQGIAEETLQRARRMIADAKRELGPGDPRWFWALK